MTPFARATAALALLGALPAHALYKVVGPDGKRHLHRPAAAAPASGAGHAGAAAAAPPAPRRWRCRSSCARSTARYPVTLYTAPTARRATSGRRLLRQRGMPFTEKTVTAATKTARRWMRIVGGPSAGADDRRAGAARAVRRRDWNCVPRRRRLPARIASCRANYQSPGADAAGRARRRSRTARRAGRRPPRPPRSRRSSRPERHPVLSRLSGGDAARAGQLPAPTAAPITQNSGADADRRAGGAEQQRHQRARRVDRHRAQRDAPRRGGRAGVRWCSVDMIIGCTAPSAMPEQHRAGAPSASAVGSNG